MRNSDGNVIISKAEVNGARLNSELTVSITRKNLYLGTMYFKATNAPAGMVIIAMNKCDKYWGFSFSYFKTPSQPGNWKRAKIDVNTLEVLGDAAVTTFMCVFKEIFRAFMQTQEYEICSEERVFTEELQESVNNFIECLQEE